MTFIHNSNGSTYEVIRKYEDMETGRNVLLLASYGGKEETAVQAGAIPTQYIVAHDWDINWRSWAKGEYFLVWHGDATTAFADAVTAFSAQIENIMQ